MPGLSEMTREENGIASVRGSYKEIKFLEVERCTVAVKDRE